MSEYIAPRSRARIFMQWLAGVLVALLAIGGFGSPAYAAGGSVTVFPVESATEHNGLPVLSEGSTYSFQLGYGSMDDGAVVAITIPDGITIPAEALVVPTGNTAVESLTMNGAGQLVVTFKNPFPADVNQGVLGLSFTVDEVETSEERELVWQVDDETQTQTVIVTTPGDTPEQTTTWSNKAAAWTVIENSVDDDGQVVIDSSALEVTIPYTVTVSSEAAREVVLTDTLGDHLAFVEGSLSGTKTVRDANGLNPVSSALDALPAISGSTFSHSFAAEANSVYTFTYRAKIADAAALDALRAQLQAARDAVDPINGGDYVVELTNGVDVNGTPHSTNTTVRGNVAGVERPGVGGAVSKSVDPSSVTLDEPLASGSTLADAIPVTYTLGIDLTVFTDFTEGPFALDRNVVIRDTLPAEASWNTGADVVLTDQHGTEIVLTQATGVTGNLEDELSADEYVNTYVLDGKNMFINVGKDITGSYTLTLSATIDALPEHPSHDTVFETEYRVDNVAYFVFAPGWYEGKGASTIITVPKDTSNGVDDPQRFDKTTPGGTITLPPGTSTTIPYTFTVGENVGDAASSRIVDVVDHSVFDVSEETLAAIKASITGTYGWVFPLDGDTFDVSIDGDGNLVIAPNAEFPKETSWGEAATAPFTGSWNITVELPTHAMQGKQTLEITNSARYEGETLEVVYTSTSSTRATSFGDEMEVRKGVYDAAGDAFTTNLRVEMDDDGNLVTSEFVYRVELVPHGNFSNMVEDVVDALPAGVEFVGFVDPENVASGETADGASYVIPGSSITAVYDADSRTVTVEKGRLAPGETLPVHFKVRVTASEANVGITNVIGSVGATITPTNDYPLSLLKRDITNSAKLITDPAARFSVLAEGRQTVVLSDLRVVEGRILTVDGKTPTVEEIGTYWLREDVAPIGYVKAVELSQIVVDETGGSADVVLFNTPGETVEPDKNYAIGDVTWIDADKDGRQGDDEQVLPGVTVELVQDGVVIRTTTTDHRGRYIFDELPAGEYQVKFTLTDEQSEIYAFTQQDAGGDDTVDSDANTQTGLTQTIILGADNIHLTHDYAWNEVRATEGIDPTWDAGVIVRDQPVDPEPTPEPVDPTPVDPAKPGTPGVNELPQTGGALPLGLAGGALLLLLAGASILFWRRRSA